MISSKTEIPVSQTQSHVKDIYLCQVNKRVSCGACCGLYNRVDASKNLMEKVLKDRTARFLTVPRTMESILDFGRKTERRESSVLKYPDFHHCPYIGLIGLEPSRAGCLLHPQSPGNNNIDYRGLSYYGGFACSTYFCPASRYLSPEIKRIIQYAADDWYIYGLTITEKTLLEAFFTEIERLLNRPVKARDFIFNPQAILSVRDFLYLKVSWPFRPDTHKGPCNYFFKDRKYQNPPVIYGISNDYRSRYHIIFKELVSTFHSAKSLQQAELTIHAITNRIIRSISGMRICR